MIKPIGVTIKKNIKPIIKGEIILPKNIPNFIHNMCKGVKILEFIIPKIKKTNEINRDHILKSLPLIKG